MERSISGKIAVAIALAVFLVAGMAWWWLGASGPGLPTTGQPIKMARYYWPGFYWIEIAQHKGWFKDAGLQVELIDANPDYHGSLKDLAAGKMDANAPTLFDLISLNVKGADLVMVVYLDDSRGADALVAAKEIATVAGLRGKKIGVGLGSYTEYVLSVVLGRSGLILEDVVPVDLTGEQAPEVFIQGKVDAVATWEPFVTQALAGSRGRKLFDSSEIPGLSPEGLTFRRSFLEQRPGDVRAMVQVWHKTTRFIQEHPQEAFGIIAGIYRAPLEQVQALAQVDRIMDLKENLTAFAVSPGYESLHTSARRMNHFLIKKGLTGKQLEIGKFLDPRFLRELK
jgi:NitT/TauT family transport system substrate-binding protein